jgi:hypothetical protein
MIETVISAVTASIIANGILLFLIKEWLTTRLKASIQAEYKQQHELFIRELDRKEKVEIISDLLAEWIKYPSGENLPNEYRTNLNKLSFKCTLWLPPKLSKELAQALQLQENAKNIFEILLMARKELIDDEELTAEHVTYWGIEKETQKDTKTSNKNERL